MSILEVTKERAESAAAGDLRVVGGVKRYGSFEALKSIDLHIRAGEFLTLLGPSGSGKTTLLNSIAGFETLDAGEITLDGVGLGNKPPHARGFGMVFQSYALFPHMTVLENVAYPLRLRGVAKSERLERARYYLDVVELGAFHNRLPAQLSGGQQQRVSLARAIVYEPPVLLMDEPLGALDRRLRESLQYSIKDLHRKVASTIIYVTHDQEEALTMSDRIAVMRDGRIEQIGTPEQIYRHPQTQFIATFLGETNLIPVRPSQNAGRQTEIFEESSGARYRLKGVLTGAPAALAVRPEDMRLSRDVATDGFVDLPAVVTGSTFVGTHWRYSCVLSSGVEVIAHLPKDATAVALSSDIRLQFDSRNATVFSEQGDAVLERTP